MQVLHCLNHTSSPRSWAWWDFLMLVICYLIISLLIPLYSLLIVSVPSLFSETGSLCVVHASLPMVDPPAQLSSVTTPLLAPFIPS
jgi:hypothetical protein